MASEGIENSDNEEIKEILNSQFRKKADPQITISSSNHEITCEVKFKKDVFNVFVNKKKNRKKSATSRWTIFIGNGLNRAFTGTNNGQLISFNEKFDLNQIFQEIFQEDSTANPSRFEKIKTAISTLERVENCANWKNAEGSFGIVEALSLSREDIDENGSLKVQIGDKICKIERFDNYQIDPLKFEILKKIFKSSNLLTKSDDFKNHLNKLNEFIKSKFKNNTIIDIATLNYDSSMYISWFGQRGSWFRKKYVDGFALDENKPKTKKKIAEAILGNKAKGKYLHLHGSYLFVEDSSGDFVKRKVTQELKEEDINKMPIILCNQEEKLKRVKYYDILNWYSAEFNNNLDECKKLFLFGYGGKDKYINKIIKEKINKNKALQVIIIQRLPKDKVSEEKKQEKANFWKGQEQLALENLQMANSEADLLDNSTSHMIFFINSLSEFTWFQDC